MRDTIRLTGVRARGHHGVFDHERADGQDFVVDVAVEVDARTASGSDDLADTVHYGVLAEQVVAEIERDPVDLIETVAERIAAAVLTHRAALATEVTVHKPQAPITVPFDDVSITIRRSVQEAGNATTDKKGMWADSSFEDLVQYNDGFRTQLFGDAEQIAERIIAYKKRGVDLFLLGFLHFQEELERFGETVIPIVRELEADLARTGDPIGVAAR